MRRAKFARKYNKRVAIQSVGQASDGFGGLVSTSNTLVQNRWCMVQSPDEASVSQYRNDYGLKSSARILKFIFRKFDFDLNSMTLSYRGSQWAPVSAQDRDEYDVETVIIAQEVK